MPALDLLGFPSLPRAIRIFRSTMTRRSPSNVGAKCGVDDLGTGEVAGLASSPSRRAGPASRFSDCGSGSYAAHRRPQLSLAVAEGRLDHPPVGIDKSPDAARGMHHPGSPCWQQWTGFANAADHHDRVVVNRNDPLLTSSRVVRLLEAGEHALVCTVAANNEVLGPDELKGVVVIPGFGRSRGAHVCGR